MTNCEPVDETDEWQPMTDRDFAIGRAFETATGTWRCTDVGIRTIAAIKVSDHQDDPSWFDGPPYAVAEVVFDEDDFGRCWPLGSTEGQDARESGPATDSDILAAVRETASDLHDAGVMETRDLDRLHAMTDKAPDGDGATRVLYVDGLVEPAARMRLMPEGVEITFLAERRAGFLAWLASGAAAHLHVLMRQHERDAVIEDMIEGWSDEEVPTGEPDPPSGKDA